VKGENCCMRCRALPGACGRQWKCPCHKGYAADPGPARVTTWDQAAAKAAKEEAERESRERSKEIESLAPWR